ncbi:MAG: hypothetical protein ACJAYU_003467 [Bradymonadia bacterium]|jgi:hypothetical protein
MDPQVFPARVEPARALWVTDDGASTVTFEYRVNPDRRILRFTGPDAEDLLRAAVASIGQVHRAELEDQILRGADEAATFCSAFLLGELLGSDAIETLLTGAEQAPDHGAWGCLRALEPLVTRSELVRLRAIRENPKRGAEVRMLAGELANRLEIF